MNAVTVAEQPARKMTQTEVYVGEVLPADSEALRSLPAGVDPKRFRHSLQIAVMQNPGLIKVDPRLTFREVAKAASLGLFLDPQLGEAYLVVSRNGKTGRDEPQLRVGYRGLLRLARQSGDLALIYAQAVHANDPFRVSYGDSPRLYHEPDPFSSERGDVVGFYAFAQHRNGDYEFETMSLRQVNAIRDLSDGFKAFRAGRIKATPWAQHYDEMARKTVLRRLLKRLPASPELINAQRLDDAEAIEDPAALGAPARRTRVTTAEAMKAIADGVRTRPETSQEQAAASSASAPDDEPAVIDDAEILATDEGGGAGESNDGATDPGEGDGDAFPVDAASPDYERGQEDRRRGLTKCVIKAIREDEARFTNWLAGWNAEGESLNAES